jgi:hypothetical protein
MNEIIKKLEQEVKKVMEGFKDGSSNFDKLKLEILNDINTQLPENLLIRFIEASITTDDNSNLYQVAELKAQQMSNSQETWKFEKFLWISEKPFAFGVALYYKL